MIQYTAYFALVISNVELLPMLIWHVHCLELILIVPTVCDVIQSGVVNIVIQLCNGIINLILLTVLQYFTISG